MLGTDCNYFWGNNNYCFIWYELSDNIRTVWNDLYNQIKYRLVWITWQKVLLGINSLITLLSTVWNEFSDKIKYYYSKSSYNVKSLAYQFYVKTKILADSHICIFVTLNCSLNSLNAYSIHYVLFTSIQCCMYSQYLSTIIFFNLVIYSTVWLIIVHYR